MPDLIDLKSHIVAARLGTLLKDRSTGRNIIFATDAYVGIGFDENITKKLLLDNGLDIRPRVSKSLEEQAQRTRKKAEVFTPAWICNKMNNHCDAEWFGRGDVFNRELENSWQTREERIEFPKGKTWQDYVYSKRLEITCGEAPYLVSRYDTATGELIPIKDRIGILDRKLRVINENTHTRKTWHQWVYRAYESVYGYEFQGDNLLIARINLLETFCEYTRDRWGAEPTESELKRIAYIISWNLWQMDGIKGIVPCAGAAEEPKVTSLFHQMTLFDEFDLGTGPEPVAYTPQTVDCKLYDWRENKEITYKSMREG